MFDNLRNNSKIIVYIVVAAFVVTGGLMGFGSYMNRDNTGGNNRSSQYIATVNDKGITPQQFLSVLRNSASQANNLSQGEIIPFRLNVLQSMIEREILLSEAENQNISVEISEKEVEQRIDEILKQNDMSEEELKDNLESQDYTYEQFKTDIRNSLRDSEKITKVKESTYSNIEVTEEEIKEAYEERYEDSEDKPELEEVRSDIKESLLDSKQNEVYQNWLESKKSEANVTINDPVLSAYNALEEGNYQVAIESFENMVDSEDSSASIYTYLAQSYAGAKKYDQAEETFNTGLEEYPENWEVRLNFGDYYADKENKEKAVEQYSKASELAGNNFYAHYKLFMAFNNIGASSEAEKEMQKITEIQQEREGEEQSEQPDSSSIEEELEKSKPESDSSSIEEDLEQTNPEVDDE